MANRHYKNQESVYEQFGHSRWLDAVDDEFEYEWDQHSYVSGRCLRCNTDWLDASIYPGLEICSGREQDLIAYSTSTGQESISSHSFD